SNAVAGYPRDVLNGGHVTSFTVDRKHFRERYRERYRKRFQLYKYAGKALNTVGIRQMVVIRRWKVKGCGWCQLRAVV
ncbi:MAG: hypothetical protein Q4D48_08025, partial [Coriobacteriales bacterium]|nr:hypothetical protein [Coriobacteriales bacterium]